MPQTKFKKFVVKRGLTQTRIASLAGLDDKTVSEIATGVRNPNKRQRRLIVRAIRQIGLNVEPGELFDIPQAPSFGESW